MLMSPWQKELENFSGDEGQGGQWDAGSHSPLGPPLLWQGAQLAALSAAERVIGSMLCYQRK